MPQNVEITVRTQLLKIAKDLEAISGQMDEAQKGLKQTTTSVDESVKQSFDKTKTGVANVAGVMRRVLGGLKEDFKALVSTGSLAAGLKLSSTMAGTVKQTVALSDAVRKLSGVFKIAHKDQAGFVGSLSKGLGEMGLSSEAGANALTGLAQTQVRGQGNLIAYSKQAGMLASISGQNGSEGEIAQGIANVITARGKSVNDPAQLTAVAEAVSRAQGATGKSATEILGNMEQLFASMNDTFKQHLSPQAAAQLTAISAAGGKGSVSFLQDYLGQNSQSRAALDALGFGGLFTNKGLNEGKLRGLIGRAHGMGLGGDVISGLTNMGVGEEQAKGLKMLFDQLEAVDRAAKEVATSTKTVAQRYDESKTLGEAFAGNIDRVKSLFSGGVARGTGALTDVFRHTQHSTLESAGVVAGGALLAGMLTKVGLGGVGSALGLKNAQERILEAKGEKVTPVRVVNFGDMKGGGLLGEAGGAAVGAVGGAGLLARIAPYLGYGGLVAGGVGMGAALGYTFDDATRGTSYDRVMTDFIMKLSQKVGLIPETVGPRGGRVQVDVKLQDRTKELKPVSPGRRGPNVGGIR